MQRRWEKGPCESGVFDKESDIAFNKELSSTRVKAECAFAILKVRWRIFQKCLDSGIEFRAIFR